MAKFTKTWSMDSVEWVLQDIKVDTRSRTVTETWIKAVIKNTKKPKAVLKKPANAKCKAGNAK
jgi:hypothetical protein